jgi:hypothetical protein
MLDVDDTRLEQQAVRGGISLTPTVSSSNAAMGVSFPAISFPGGSFTVDVTFTRTFHGTLSPVVGTNLTVNQPAGMTVPLGGNGLPSIFVKLACIFDN